ncbi:energy-coupling factor ABC transporter permease [Thauera sp. 2A1]|uniref:energy-coupling factor ABC transporter permease n=1 Tax=Thauera sp. 2A1 TaxID=2570191 RepID=UPI001292926D|nr:energy-coupling factor ABC transporter permease [Thauera sp. 2A1]KAI5913513.1 energy-coupling factor ABC transporter permease [Thauera sp. 2A1]MBS0552762.1 energy-coupling factor ABC transporter permease [Pseudomonadota bacterium]
MNLEPSQFSTTWHVFMLLLALAAGYDILRRAPWTRLREGPTLNVMLGCATALTLLWSMKAGVKPGLDLHLVGAMAATLILGPRLAMVAMALALCGIALNGSTEWLAWPVNFMLMVVVPVLIAAGLQRLVERWLPAHFFIFIFVIGFAGAALTVILQGVFASLVLALAGAYPAEFLMTEYLPFFLLLGFSEAWISGAVVTLLVIYKPEWVSSFDDDRYLLNK